MAVSEKRGGLATGIESVESAPFTPPKVNGPKFGTARPAAPGAVPRFVDGLERVGSTGPRRFRTTCMNYRDPNPKPARYIVAKDAAEAIAFYRKEFKLDADMAAYGKDAPQPDIVAIEQPD